VIAVAAGCAALAVLLLWRPSPRLVGPPRRLPVVVLVAVAGALVVPQVGALALVVAGAAAGAHGLWRRRRRRRDAERVAAQVQETCELLAGELAAGRPPGEALDRAAAAWPPLLPAAEAFRVGADVPAALREIAAGLEGARDLRIVAAAWQVAHRSGSGLSGALSMAAERLRAERATARVVATEMAAAQATARLLAVLPVGVLLLGSGVGGDPFGFLLDTTAGLVCLCSGLALEYAGLSWLAHIADRVVGRR